MTPTVFSALFDNGRLVIDASLVVVVYYVAMSILRLRDDVQKLRTQLLGEAQVPGAVPRLEQQVKDLENVVFTPHHRSSK